MDPSLGTEAGKTLLNYEVLGVYAALSLIAITFLVRRLLNEMEGRRKDNKEMLIAITSAATAASALKESIDTATSAMTDGNAYRQEMVIGMKAIKEMIESAVGSAR